MMIKAQDSLPPDWWAMRVRARVREIVPPGVSVRVREDAVRCTLEVWLRESRRRRLACWLRLARVRRGGVLARVSCELADAPAGLLVRVGWE